MREGQNSVHCQRQTIGAGPIGLCILSTAADNNLIERQLPFDSYKLADEATWRMGAVNFQQAITSIVPGLAKSFSQHSTGDAVDI